MIILHRLCQLMRAQVKMIVQRTAQGKTDKRLGQQIQADLSANHYHGQSVPSWHSAMLFFIDYIY